MAVTPESSRTEIRTYQQQLNDAGAQPPLVIDGLWGPKTQAANDQWGDSVSKSTDGDGTSSALEGTGPEGTEPRFGLAGGAQLWKDTTSGQSFIVYVVPGTESDPVYMRWTVATEADVQSFFGPGQPVVYQNEYAGNDPVWAETVDFGSSDDIANVSKNPFDSWASTLEVQAVSQPWVLDDDYQKLLAMSIIEGRPLLEEEVATTKWWRDNEPAQRAWMLFFNSDPSGAERKISDNRIEQATFLRENGLDNASEELINFVADMVTMGNWSQTYMQQQVRIMSDPYFSDLTLDGDLQNFVDDSGITFDTTEDKENEVRNLVTRWLGTNFGNWDDELVGEWASRLRNEPDSVEALVETLKDQRFALFPEYDREADYATIAAPWKTMIRNTWGEMPNDSDATLQSVIRMNNAGDAGKYLTEEGLKRGNDNVVNGVQGELVNTFGGI